MKEFGGKIAVVTGGGTGMGRELVCQLVEEGADAVSYTHLTLPTNREV